MGPHHRKQTGFITNSCIFTVNIPSKHTDSFVPSCLALYLHCFVSLMYAIHPLYTLALGKCNTNKSNMKYMGYTVRKHNQDTIKRIFENKKIIRWHRSQIHNSRSNTLYHCVAVVNWPFYVLNSSAKLSDGNLVQWFRDAKPNCNIPWMTSLIMSVDMKRRQLRLKVTDNNQDN